MNHHNFSKALLDWYHKHGRHDLPWQKNPTPYRVWISEIMLQQTQVKTVIPYYLRFMTSFPNLKALANASQDDVLSHWSGLGYYARARNLHKAAQIIQEKYHGRFPATVDAIRELPGIGRSTAGAILSFSKQQFAVILDGNVKRVLTRYFAINKPINNAKEIKALWEIATGLTPSDQAHHYNQAIMDLGATLCTRTKPNCSICPFHNGCEGYKSGSPTQFPIKIQKKARPTKHTRMLIIQNQQSQILLIKRPNTGIWGGLWSFPECDHNENHTSWSTLDLTHVQELPMLTHQFTHFTLNMTPTRLALNQEDSLDSYESIWYTLGTELPGGIATPVSNLLTQLSEHL